MKPLKINKIIAFLISLMVFTCIEDDDFNVPDTSITEPEISANNIVSISSVAGELAQAMASGNSTFTFQFDNDSNYMEGFIISTDEAGNFFEELIIQDKTENPTTGIRLRLNVNPLFIRYEFGRKVFIKLDGLSVGMDNGVLTMGVLDGARIEQIPAPLENEFILRTTAVASIVPLDINLEELSDDLTNLYVRVQNVQFNRFEALREPNPATFASEPDDEFDGERTLESCENNASLTFATSTFADFASLNLPTGSGNVNGIFTKNFFGDEFNLVVNSATDISFENPERCDPVEVSCGIASAEGTNNLFSDDFETQTNNNLISGNGWTNYIQEGTEGWEAFTSGGSNASLGRSARVSSFGSDDVSTIAWLITPAIDFDAQDGETLSFMTSNSFSDSSTMEVLLSTNWDGTEAGIPSANWGILSDATIVSDDEFFGNWVSSGIVDLSCISGTAYIAFRYIGNDANDDFNGTYELDEIKISSN